MPISLSSENHRSRRRVPSRCWKAPGLARNSAQPHGRGSVHRAMWVKRLGRASLADSIVSQTRRQHTLSVEPSLSTLPSHLLPSRSVLPLPSPSPASHLSLAQDPFKWGADLVMHSATKYFGGRECYLVLTVPAQAYLSALNLLPSFSLPRSSPQTRTRSPVPSAFGTNHNGFSFGITARTRAPTLARVSPLGLVARPKLTSQSFSLSTVESWLILRSLRTLPLRITRQATTATALAQWLASLTRAAPGSSLDGLSGVIDEVWHGTLQTNASSLIGEAKQMSMGSACFAFTTTKPIYAEWLGHVLKLFVVSRSGVDRVQTFN